MKQFILITVGFTQPTSEVMQSWMEWFESIKDKIVDQIGLANGKEVTPESINSLPMDKNSLTGYLVINAKNMDEATKIAQSCPMVTSTQIYELMSHKK